MTQNEERTMKSKINQLIGMPEKVVRDELLDHCIDAGVTFQTIGEGQMFWQMLDIFAEMVSDGVCRKDGEG